MTDFIEDFIDYTKLMGSPKLFRLWTAIWMVGACVERRVKITNAKGDLLPNVFAILASPPGVGKTGPIKAARQIVGSLGDKRLSASSLSVAAFADQLNRNSRSIIDPKTQKAESYHCANILSAEFQVLFPQYNTDLLGCKQVGELHFG